MFLQQASYTPSFGGLGVRAKLKTIGTPSLEALFEAAYESAGEEFDAFLQAMLTARAEALQ